MVTYPPHNLMQHCCSHVKSAPLDFMEAEATGVLISAKCKMCINCPKCSFTEAGMSMKEYLELQEIRAGISYDPEARWVTFHYPYNEKVTQMHDNQHQAEKRAVSLEKSLTKKGYLEEYNKNIDDYVYREVCGWMFQDLKLMNGNQRGSPFILWLIIALSRKKSQNEDSP